MTASAPTLELRTPRLLTAGAVFTISLYGLVLVIPVLVSMLVVSVLRFGVLTFVIPLGTIAAVTFFLPLGFGNPYVTKLVRSLEPLSDGKEDRYIVQLTRNPRNRSGLLALLEDADDIGFLSFTDSALVFAGDSMRLSVPFDRIKDLKLQTTGWRALFAYGSQTAFSVAGLEGEGSFAFAERSSWFLPASRKTARRMYQRVRLGAATDAKQSSAAEGEPRASKS